MYGIKVKGHNIDAIKGEEKPYWTEKYKEKDGFISFETTNFDKTKTFKHNFNKSIVLEIFEFDPNDKEKKNEKEQLNALDEEADN